jgi:saccharopine dehydrogenase-like NADP-dependent oxidoreductase
MQGPFANPEVYRFPEPVGEVLICSHSHDESYTLPFFIGKGLKECDFKYAVDEQAGTLVAMGFGDPEKVIELRDGTKVRPFEVAMALTPQAKEGFFAETKEGLADLPDWEASMIIAANGRQDGRPKRVRVRRTYSINHKTRSYLLAKLGTTNPLVAAPAIAAAKLITNGQVRPGVMAVEALDPLAYLKEVTAIMPLDIDVSVTTALPA